MAYKPRHKIYGIIGCPVEHSLSPYMHNAAFAALKIKAVYLPFSVKENRLKEAIAALESNGVSGFNVTIPFKHDCIKYLDKVEPTARIIDAVNTVVARKSKLIGYNTDYIGFLRSLREELLFKPRGKKVFIYGAGGAARAIAFGLVKTGASSLFIYDILKSRSSSLARNIKRYFPLCHALPVKRQNIRAALKGCQLLVHCTPMGMNASDPLPIDVRALHKALKLYDIVYTPLETRLVKTAQAMGIHAVGGLGMLLYQGAEAFKIWTMRKPPISLMRKELIAHLSC